MGVGNKPGYRMVGWSLRSHTPQISLPKSLRSALMIPHYNYQPCHSFLSLPATPAREGFCRDNNENQVLSLLNTRVGRNYDWNTEEEFQNSTFPLKKSSPREWKKKDEKKRSVKNEPSWVTKILEYEYIVPDIPDNWWKNKENYQQIVDKKGNSQNVNHAKNEALGKGKDMCDKRNCFVSNTIKRIRIKQESKVIGN